jgi:hypothetical protein
MLKRYLSIAVVAVVILPSAASADFLFTPYAGRTFAKDAKGYEHGTYGASVGWMGGGVAGVEVDFGFVPNFFEPRECLSCADLTGKNNVVSLMFNGMLGAPIGGQSGGGVRPYVVGGIGLLRQQVPEVSSFLKVTNNDFGVNAGVGVMGFVSDHVGLRGDLRYFRSVNSNDSFTNPNLSLGNFDFWRWTVGVTFR